MARSENEQINNMTSEYPFVAAVVLAAGMSRRMGQPKMILPWGETTVIGQVVFALHQAGVSEIVVVTGGDRELVEKALLGQDVRTVFNAHYQQDHMLLSLQVGLQNLSEQIAAALVVIGDQPYIESGLVRKLIELYRSGKSQLIAPSYQRRRGHPWLAANSLWPDLISQKPPTTLREWLQKHASAIEYLNVQSDLILRDLDTPADYLRERPEATDT